MKLTGIAREDLEAKGLVLPNKLELEYRGTEIPDIYAAVSYTHLGIIPRQTAEI